MSSRAKIADGNLVPTDSAMAEETSPVPSTSQTAKASAMPPPKPEFVYALPSLRGYSNQQKLDAVLLLLIRIDTEHCCCKFLDKYSVKLKRFRHTLLTTGWPGSINLKDNVPFSLQPFVTTQLNVLMKSLNFSQITHVLEYTKQNIIFINDQFHAFVDGLCLKDASASLQTLEQIKSKMISIELKHASSMNQVDEIEKYIKDIADFKINFHFLFDGMRANSVKTFAKLQRLNDRLGTVAEEFSDAITAYKQFKTMMGMCSTDLDERLGNGFDRVFDVALLVQCEWSDSSDSDADTKGE